MARFSDIAHRWANQDFGKNGTLHAGSCRCDEYSFYSYNTVIGQWLDKEKKIMAVVDVNLSHSSNRHISALRSALPDDVKVFYLHDEISYYQWQNVDFVSKYTPFSPKIRMRMIEIYIRDLYAQFTAIRDTRMLRAEKPSMTAWHYIQQLNKLYRDASPKKWIENKIPNNTCKEDRTIIIQKRKMVRGLIAGLQVSEIVESMFGKGTWDEYQKRIAPLKKTARKRDFAAKVCDYLHVPQGTYSYKQIKQTTPAERIALKFSALREPDWCEKYFHKNEAINRAKIFLGIKSNLYGNGVQTVVDSNTGEIIYHDYHVSDWWDYARIQFGEYEYAHFCRAVDKKQYRKRFHQICSIKNGRIQGKMTYNAINSGRQRIEDLSEENLRLYNAYLLRKDRHEIEEQLQRYSLKYQKNLSKEQLLEKVRAKQQQIEEYKKQGIEGYRRIWREHLGGINYGLQSKDSSFFYGGNVLLRFREDGRVESSKNITLSVSTCKRMFQVIERWHNAPDTFKPVGIVTENCGTFKITEYKNDILVAGCHRIAYAEMERMYNEILNRESEQQQHVA